MSESTAFLFVLPRNSATTNHKATNENPNPLVKSRYVPVPKTGRSMFTHDPASLENLERKVSIQA